MSDLFPKTVFVKELPSDYKLSEVTELLGQFGVILEINQMEDGHLLVRFQNSQDAKQAVFKASGKKGQKLLFKGKPIHVIPKRNRKKYTE